MDSPSFGNQQPGDEGRPSEAFTPEPVNECPPVQQPASVELESGWTASRALLQFSGDELLALMLRPSFRPVRDLDLVPVLRCPYCQDGGLRTAGSLRTRRGRELIHACDTCGTLRVGEQGRL